MTLTTLQLQTNPKIEGIWTHLRVGAPPIIDADDNVDGDSDERSTNKEGYTAFGYVPKGDAYVLVRGCARGFTDQLVGPIHMPHDDLVTVDLVPVRPTRLRNDGWDIVDESGARYVHNQATNFLLLQRFLIGSEAPFYPGFNGYRFTSLMKIVPGQIGLPELRPENYNMYWQGLEILIDKLAAAGKRCEITVCCDVEWMGLDTAYLKRHVAQLFELVKHKPNVMVEGVNEVGHEGNAVDLPAVFGNVPDEVFFCVGSSLSGGPSPLFHRNNYHAFHLPRDENKTYTDAPPIYMINGYPGYPGTRWTRGPAVISNEGPGAAESDRLWARYTDWHVAYRLGRMLSAWNGGTFHSEDGVFSRPLGPNQQVCADAWNRGMGGR